MPIIAIIALMWVACLSSCVSHDANAFTISESQQEYDERMDFESIRSEVNKVICDAVSCPQGVHLEELKVKNMQLASIKASIKWEF